jgi:hypothetical protein
MQGGRVMYCVCSLLNGANRGILSYEAHKKTITWNDLCIIR